MDNQRIIRIQILVWWDAYWGIGGKSGGIEN